MPFFEIPYPTLKDRLITTKTQKGLRKEIKMKSAGHPMVFRWLGAGGGTKFVCHVERM